MTSAHLLRTLGVDPFALDPAPPWTPCGSAHIKRLAERHRCICCGTTATVAGVIEDPRYGRRWLDRCTACLAATTPRSTGPRPPVAPVLAVLRAAAGAIGTPMTITYDGQ